MYIGIDGIARLISKLYIGINGIAREITKMYIGVDGLARLIYQAGVAAGEVVFTSSKSWTVPAGVSKVDIFCVGGGGGAGGWYFRYNESNSAGSYTDTTKNGGSGGGGYTTTALAVAVTPGETLTITVGAGGDRGESYEYYKSYGETAQHWGSVTSSGDITAGATGGQSSVKNSSGTVLCSANGGSGGAKATTGTSSGASYVSAGGAGGSGGGTSTGCYYVFNGSQGDITTHRSWFSAGGSTDIYRAVDGESGPSTEYYSASSDSTPNVYSKGGTGQGTTTRYFAQSGGTLYGSGGTQPYDATKVSIGYGPWANTGHGGGYVWYDGWTGGSAGSSGVVIIRWAAQ